LPGQRRAPAEHQRLTPPTSGPDFSPHLLFAAAGSTAWPPARDFRPARQSTTAPATSNNRDQPQPLGQPPGHPAGVAPRRDASRGHRQTPPPISPAPRKGVRTTRQEHRPASPFMSNDTKEK
jgi:hypothetical protein